MAGCISVGDRPAACPTVVGADESAHNALCATADLAERIRKADGALVLADETSGYRVVAGGAKTKRAHGRGARCIGIPDDGACLVRPDEASGIGPS